MGDGRRGGAGAVLSTTYLSIRLCLRANNSAPLPPIWGNWGPAGAVWGLGATGGGGNLLLRACMKLQASAPRFRESSSGPDSNPGSFTPLGFSSRFCTIDSSSGLGELCFFSSGLLNMGFLPPRRRASCRMPVREAGTEILCSRDARASAELAAAGYCVETGVGAGVAETGGEGVVVATVTYGLKDTFGVGGGGIVMVQGWREGGEEAGGERGPAGVEDGEKGMVDIGVGHVVGGAGGGEKGVNCAGAKVRDVT